MNDSSNSSRVSSSVRAIIGAEVLIVDKDESVQQGIACVASEVGMHATSVSDPSDAWGMLEKRFFSVAIVDLDTPHPNAGIDTVNSIKMVSKTTSVIVLTPRKSYDAALDALRAGAVDVVQKTPAAVAYLKDKLVAAAGRSLQERQLSALLQEASGVHENFLELLMKAEREVLDLQDTISQREYKPAEGAIRILVVDPKPEFPAELQSSAPAGFLIEHCQTGGEALDRSSSTSFQFALVSRDLPDLPQSMVSRSLKAQSPELVALTYGGPGPGASIEIADAGPGGIVVSDFVATRQLVERLPELGEAFFAKEQQRRYTQAFRAKHYDFVRKFVSFKEKLDEVAE